MGCTFSTAYHQSAQPEIQLAQLSRQVVPVTTPTAAGSTNQQAAPAGGYSPSTCFPVPFGHIPYTPSLPDAMGPLWDYPIEWWYYGGWATDVTGSKKFTVLLQIVRLHDTLLEEFALSDMLVGIGYRDKFISNQRTGIGKFPKATSSDWSIYFSNGGATATMSCKLMSGILGLSGASYQLDIEDQAKKVSASFMLKDNFGMIMEGGSGAFHKTASSSLEYALPSLTIQSGSSITIDGTKTTLGGGSLWLDRQTISHSVSHFNQPLYTGNWLAITMNDNTVYNLVFFWPTKNKQWQVGSELQPPVYPTGRIGLEYPSLPGWQGQSLPPANGVIVLGQDEFDLNLLNADDPNNSPHWTSPTSNNTYSTAWRLMIKGNIYSMKAWVPKSEVSGGLGGSIHFFEGAASIYNHEGEEVGHAFVEEMGYN